MKAKLSLVLCVSVVGAFALAMVGAQAQPPSPAPTATPQAPAPGRGGQVINAQDAEALYTQRCKGCHEPPILRAPARSSFTERTAENILQVMTSGIMSSMAEGLSQAQLRGLAVHLSGRQLGQPAAVLTTDAKCDKSGSIRLTPSSWTSWGMDPGNTRFQRNPGLTVRQIPRLKLKWAFSVPRGGSYGQPTVVGDRLFMVSRGGEFYSLDARTGCVHWKVANVPARTTPIVERRPDISPSGWVTFIGGPGRAVIAFDAQDGKEIWRSVALETHTASGITGSPILHGDQLFVPLSSSEEGTATRANYACCSFRGQVVALDAKTGQIKWRTSVVQEPMRPNRLNAQGVQLQGPAGGAIWSAPTVDAKRGLIYVATGDSYTEVDTKGADAIVALDMATGAIRWINQVTTGDNFLVDCDVPRANRPINCPAEPGPDFDFGASPILKTMANGKDIILSGQKSGVVYGMDPDNGGKTLWSTKVGVGSTLGGIEWGIAADDRYVYAPNSDLIVEHDAALRQMGRRDLLTTPPPAARPGLNALDIATGRLVWHIPAPRLHCTYAPNAARSRAPFCFNSQSAAVSVMPGAVFSGTVDGRFRAYSTVDGDVLWEYDTTAQTYDTVNGVKGQPGGSIDSVGPTIAGGMVYTMSGYNGSSGTGGNGTNVLLAFSVDGK